MHFYAIAVVTADQGDDVEAAIEKLLAPYSEESSDGGWWDWWQIGGRWTGKLSGYDPRDDPQNIETCRICGGTGQRSDEAQGVPCNGCEGSGRRVKWATDFASHDGDVQRVDDILERGVPYTLVTPDGAWHKERWDGSDFTPDPQWEATFGRELAKWRGHLAVVVDYQS